jgi:hypothetical protein
VIYRFVFALILAAGLSARGQVFPPAVPIDVAGVKLSVGGFIQADATLLDQTAEDELDPASRQPLNTERIDLRRAHVRLDAQKSFVGAALEIDANTVHGSQLQVIAAEVMADLGGSDPKRVPTLLLSLGITRIPFGYETLQHDLLRPFLEQSNVNRALFPGSYQPGLRARGEFRFLRYDVAAMSGEPIGASQFAAQAPTHSLDFVGRFGVHTDLLDGVTFDAGVSGLDGRGFSPGTPTTKDQLVWRDDNGDGIVEISEIQILAGSAGEPSSTFRRFAAGADAHLSWRLPFGLLVAGGELIWSQNLDRSLFPADPVATGRNQRGTGYSASAVVQELPGNLAAGVRYDSYNPDADAADSTGTLRVPFDASVSTLAFMASVRLETVMRLMIEYDLNHNAFGRGVNGVPASLAANALTARAELAF